MGPPNVEPPTVAPVISPNAGDDPRLCVRLSAIEDPRRLNFALISGFY